MAGETKKPASVESKKNLNQIAEFKDTLPATFKETIGKAQAAGFERFRLWSQDESRCGLFPIIRHRITAKGVQPIISSELKTDNFYLFGAVEPLTGEQFVLELPVLNHQTFQIFLDHFAAADKESFHVLLVDNATFHTTPQLQIPANVGFRFVPPHSPELNPIERFWRDVKDWLATQTVETLEDLSNLLVSRLNSYATRVVKSLTSFDYLMSSWLNAFV